MTKCEALRNGSVKRKGKATIEFNKESDIHDYEDLLFDLIQANLVEKVSEGDNE